jgi:hypothetical protein
VIAIIDQDKASEKWLKLLKWSFEIPFVKIDREEFLIRELTQICTTEQVNIAIESSPQIAGVAKEELIIIGKRCLVQHIYQTAIMSFIAGLPGGIFMIFTLPLDVLQFYWNVKQVIQKFLYLFGWPNIYCDKNKLNEDFSLRITKLFGIMFGSKEATLLIAGLSKKIAAHIIYRFPQQTLTRYGILNLAIQLAKWVGIILTKETLTEVIYKLVPFIGGFISASISLVLMKAMTGKLLNHLTEDEQDTRNTVYM